MALKIVPKAASVMYWKIYADFSCIQRGADSVENRPMTENQNRNRILRRLSEFRYNFRIHKCFHRSKLNLYIYISPQIDSLKNFKPTTHVPVPRKHRFNHANLKKCSSHDPLFLRRQFFTGGYYKGPL
jgi:hypothetical protein